MSHTHSLDVVGGRIFDLITANKAPLAIDNVWYGDQEAVPDGRTVCVEPVNVTRPMSGVPDMVTNTFGVAVLVYVTKVQDVQLTRRECDVLTSAVADLLHQHLNLDDDVHTPGSDLVVHGWVVEHLSGYSYKSGKLVRSGRLTWQGISKTSLRFGP